MDIEREQVREQQRQKRVQKNVKRYRKPLQPSSSSSSSLSLSLSLSLPLPLSLSLIHARTHAHARTRAQHVMLSLATSFFAKVGPQHHLPTDSVVVLFICVNTDPFSLTCCSLCLWSLLFLFSPLVRTRECREMQRQQMEKEALGCSDAETAGQIGQGRFHRPVSFVL